MSATAAASPLETVMSSLEESKNGYLKNFSIIRSTSASVSLLASFLLIWIMNRSRSRFTTTYHRLILGMSIIDIVLSMSLVTFGLIAPAELSYMVWNARGNLATCDVFGFMASLGNLVSPMYNASLNLYYLAKIKYNKPDWYIARKLEPLLHAVPILYGLVMSIPAATQGAINATHSGHCITNPYNPPHCNGFEDGQIPDGFEIPCGRGKRFYQGSGAVLVFVHGVMGAFVIPIIIGGSLFAIYRSISRQERRMVRYGVGALGEDDAGSNSGVAVFSSIITSITRSVRSRFGRGSGSRNQDSSHSRAVSSRAAAYSISYLVTSVWATFYAFIFIAGAWPTKVPYPTWAVTYNYFWNFFQPLQGLWTLLIFMQPKVAHARRMSDRDISWTGAFLDAFWLATTGRAGSPCLRRTRREDDTTPDAVGIDEMKRTTGSTAISGVGRANVATPGAGGTDSSPAAEESTRTQGGVNTEHSPKPGASHDTETNGAYQNEGTTASPEVEAARDSLHA